MKQSGYLIEACVDSLQDARYAASHGAHRLELCSDLQLDGLTPSAILLNEVKDQVDLPIHAMVRPRAGNFSYSSIEIQQMLRQIDQFHRAGIAAVVFGVLTARQQINLEQTALLARHASPMKVTFHKAFDLCPDPVKGLADLMEIPQVTSILTSGGQPTAWEGLSCLRQLVNAAAGRIEIIAAGKVTRDNLSALHSELQAPAYHGRRIV